MSVAVGIKYRPLGHYRRATVTIRGGVEEGPERSSEFAGTWFRALGYQMFSAVI